MRRTWTIPLTQTLTQFIRQVEQRVSLCVQSRTPGPDGRPVRRERELCGANASLIRSHVQREQLVEVGVDSIFSDPGPNTIGGPSRHQRQTTPAWVGLDWASDHLQRMIDNPRMPWPQQIDVFRRALDALSNEECNWRSGNRGIGGLRNLSDLETLRRDMVEFFRTHYGQRYTPPRCNPHPNAAAGRLLDRIFERLPRPDTRRPQGVDAAQSR